MEYQVWTHADYEGWSLEECGDLDTALLKIMEALKQGKEPILTQVIPYDVNIKVKEAKAGEAIKSKAKPGKGPGAEGKGEVRPGDTAAVSELGKGSGDNSSSDRVPGK